MSTPTNGPDKAQASASEPSDEDLKSAPVVAITEVAGGVVEANGEAVRVCFQTATQGLVTLHFEASVLAQLAEMVVNFQNAAFRAAKKAGKPPQRVYFHVSSFGVAEMANGVLMHLNMNEQAERLYVLGDPGHAVALGQALIKQAGITSRNRGAAGLTARPRKLILPGNAH